MTRFEGMSISPMTAHVMIKDNGALLVDVRSEKEYNAHHAEGAVNIPYEVIAKGIDALLPSKARQIVLYSNFAGRSLQSAEKLVDMGFKCVCRMTTLREANMIKDVNNVVVNNASVAQQAV